MKNILVLDDEPCVRGFLKSVLPTHGYPVIEATCPVEATEKSADANGGVSLLIAEVMPPCSGVPVSVQLKASIRPLKVLLVSRLPPEMWPDYHATQLRNLPPDFFKILTKPFTHSDILRAVTDLIGEAEIP